MLLRSAVTSILALTLSLSTLACNAQSETQHGPIPPPQTDAPLATSPGHATAVFAGGCFWGTQAVFERVKGVLKTTAGYSGGSASTAHYDDVTTETTGHAESVEVVYDPSRLTYGQLLRVFFTIHDPTTLNRQGPDVGTSYRSAIFFSTPEQQRIATAYIAQLDAANAWPHRIVTQVVPLKGFYRAEDYHQDFALKNPNNSYIQVCDRPKITTLQTDYPDLYVPYHGH
ncbi:MAG TPA: peptide-methionine (S)-S-oxide reductase MsrA [Bryocella sp.]|nr:peptide-methionine (S)-S-oxide reductase MsrA [Bryocella sp.]